ncbi:hypothetical protein KEM54_000493 [Ascosphaera aggregata]|nr:hypothetical protein KEM54_000493 [Ascosphaera aggregata]
MANGDFASSPFIRDLASSRKCYVGVAFEVFLGRGLKRRKDGENAVGDDVERKSSIVGKKDKSEQQQQQQQKKKTTAKGSKRKHDDVADEDEDEDDQDLSSDKKKNKKKKHANDTTTTTEATDIESSCWAHLDKYLSMLEEGALSPVNFEPSTIKPEDLTPEAKATIMPKGPDGLRYHVMDIWNDEIEKVAAVSDEEEEEVMNEAGKVRLKEWIPLQLLLRPIANLKQNSITKMVRKRAAETLADSERFLVSEKEEER